MGEFVGDYVATFGYTPTGARDGTLFGMVQYSKGSSPRSVYRVFEDQKFIDPEAATAHARKRFGELVEAGLADPET